MEKSTLPAFYPLFCNNLRVLEGRRGRAAEEERFLQVKDECWQRAVQYVHVLHCHSDSVPVEESYAQCHEALSCVLISAPSGPHSAQSSWLLFPKAVISSRVFLPFDAQIFFFLKCSFFELVQFVLHHLLW